MCPRTRVPGARVVTGFLNRDGFEVLNPGHMTYTWLAARFERRGHPGIFG
jgi:hypothetical protein